MAVTEALLFGTAVVTSDNGTVVTPLAWRVTAGATSCVRGGSSDTGGAGDSDDTSSDVWWQRVSALSPGTCGAG